MRKGAKKEVLGAKVQIDMTSYTKKKDEYEKIKSNQENLVVFEFQNNSNNDRKNFLWQV